MTNKNETKDELVPPATPGEETPAEPAAPSYVTREEAQRLADAAAKRAAEQAYDKASRHFQSITDRRVRQVEDEFKGFRSQVELAERQREEAQIAELPAEERATAYAKIAYERVKKLEDRKPAEAPVPAAPERPAVPAESDVVTQVRQQALALAQELGANYHDMRLWEGMAEGLSVEQNLDIFRANAQKLGASNGATPPAKPPTKPAAAAQKPEPVPTRTAPASTSRQMTDEEIQEWVTRTGGFDKKANEAYREMENRWHAG